MNTTNLSTAASHDLSTIGTEDLMPIAKAYVKKFTKKTDGNTLMRYFGSHVSIDDLTMDAVEKVVRANPMYITASYVRLAARCVCIDALYKNKIPQVEIQSLMTFEDGDAGPIEESIEGDIYDFMGEQEAFLETTMGPEELSIFKGLQSRKMYIEIAEDLNLSLRTFERKVRDLKWKVTYLLMEEEPISQLPKNPKGCHTAAFLLSGVPYVHI